MDFQELLNVASSNKYEAESEASVKRYSTTVSAARKAPKHTVQSRAVQNFLARKKIEEEQKANDERRKKEELLALRAQNSKNSKKAKIMASRTKDNDFSRIKLTEDEREAIKKRENEILRMQLNDKVARMKARLEMQEKEKLLPRKRKRKSKQDDAGESNQNCDEDSNYISNQGAAEGRKKTQKKSKKEMELEAVLAEMAAEKKKNPYAKEVKGMNRKKKLPPKPSLQSFNEILQLASQKQHEPIKLPEVRTNDSQKRPLTQKEKAMVNEEQARAQRRMERENAGTSQVSSKSNKSQGGVAKNVKSMHNTKVVDQNNNEPVRNNLNQKISYQKVILKSVKPQYDGRMNPPVSQREPPTPTKSLPQKNMPRIPRKEIPVPPRHPSPIPRAKDFSNNNKHSVNIVRSHCSGSVPAQMPKQGSSSTSLNAQNQKLTSAKHQVNGVNQRSKEQQPQDTGRPQKKIIRNSNSSSRFEGGKNPKQTIYKESFSFKQPTKEVNGEANEEHALDELFAPGEALLRTEKGNYVQSSKDFKLNTKSAQSNLPQKGKSLPNIRTSAGSESISRKQPVLQGNKVYGGPDVRSNAEKRIPGSREPVKTTASPGFRDQNASLPIKNTFQRPPLPQFQRGIPNFSSEKPMKPRTPNERPATGKVPPLHRPPTLSAKTEMRKQPGVPASRSSGSAAGKPSAGSQPFHINPYLEPPRRLLEPQRPEKPSMKRRIESDEEDDDDDDDMRDFIDDGPCYDDTDYSEHIREIFRYDRRKYLDDEDDIDNMESSYAEQMKEELRSAKLGYLEDLEDMRKEEDEKRRKMIKKKRLKT